MENTEPPVTRRRKIIQAAILLTLLVVFPALSYYYLGLGFKKHQETQAELRHYGQVRKENLIYPDGVKEDRLKGKVCIVYYFGENPDLTDLNRKVIATGEALFQQFSGEGRRDDIRLVMIARGGTAEFKSFAQTQPSAEFITWVWSQGLESWKTIIDQAFAQFQRDEGDEIDPNCFMLADTDGAIRRFYPVSDDKQINKMVNHIATLLPKDK
jgi:hypothetical protein